MGSPRGPSVARPVKKGAFMTPPPSRPFLSSAQLNAQRLANVLYALNTSQCGSSKRTATSRCSGRRRLSGP